MCWYEYFFPKIYSLTIQSLAGMPFLDTRNVTAMGSEHLVQRVIYNNNWRDFLYLNFVGKDKKKKRIEKNYNQTIKRQITYNQLFQCSFQVPFHDHDISNA